MNLRAPAHFATQRRELVQNRLQKRGLAGAIRSDDAQAFTAAQYERSIARQQIVFITDRKLVDSQHVIAGSFDRAESKVSGRLIVTHCVDALEFLEHLATRLRLLRLLARDVATNELFRLGNQLLLVVVSTLLRFTTLFTLDEVVRVVTGVA